MSKRYIQLIMVFLRASLSVQLEYRANFIISIISAAMASASALFGLFLLSGDGTPIGGWSYAEATIVVGVYTIVQGFIGAVLAPNLPQIAEAVRLGTMDFTLLKPIDAQFMVSARNINVFRSIDILAGLIIVAIAGVQIGGFQILNILIASIMLVCALLIVYAIWFMLTTTAFWFVKVANITELFNGFFRAGQFPVAAFPGWVRSFFTIIVPVAFITTIPSEALTNRLTLSSALTTIAVTIVLLVVSRLIWKRAVGSYTSASS
jgi:ABC-2 type transport system permease protein